MTVTYHNFPLTTSDRVPLVSLGARADGTVVDNLRFNQNLASDFSHTHLASGARSTSPGAGVPAIVLLACQGS